MTNMKPRIPNPITFAITIATSQLTSNADAKVSRTHLGGGSEPSVGTLPSGVSHLIRSLFSFKLCKTKVNDKLVIQ